MLLGLLRFDGERLLGDVFHMVLLLFDVLPRAVRRFVVVVEVRIRARVLQDLIDVHLDLLCKGGLDILEAVLGAELLSQLIGLPLLALEDDDVLGPVVAEVNGDTDDLFLALGPVLVRRPARPLLQLVLSLHMLAHLVGLHDLIVVEKHLCLQITA